MDISLDHRGACFETPLSGFLSMRTFLCAIKDLPHPEEAGRALARTGVSKDAQCSCSFVHRRTFVGEAQ
jgi:hypothetical protein